MTRELLNTLFVTTPDAYVRLDHDTIKVEVEGKKIIQVPLHHLGSIILFGNAMISCGAMQRCAEDGRAIVLLDYAGRFKARVTGPTGGNVLLRQAQYETFRSDSLCANVARTFVAGKIRNSRQTIGRAARDTQSAEKSAALRT